MAVAVQADSVRNRVASAVHAGEIEMLKSEEQLNAARCGGAGLIGNVYGALKIERLDARRGEIGFELLDHRLRRQAIDQDRRAVDADGVSICVSLVSGEIVRYDREQGKSGSDEVTGLPAFVEIVHRRHPPGAARRGLRVGGRNQSRRREKTGLGLRRALAHPFAVEVVELASDGFLAKQPRQALIRAGWRGI